MTKFKVGQIVYVLNNDTRSIKPAQIVIENRQKTLKGTIISYDAHIAGKLSDETTKIDDSNYENVFESSKKLRDYLISNATKAINDLIDDAEKQSKCFDEISNDINHDIHDDEDEQKEQIKQEDNFNDGLQTVRVRMPDGSVEVHRM